MRIPLRPKHHPPLLKTSALNRAEHKVIPLVGKHLLGACTFCVAMVVVAQWSTGFPDWSDVLVAENGPVERMSTGAWLMITVWCFAAGLRNPLYRLEWLGLTMFSLLFGLRELDAHLWATGWNLDKLANYWNPHFPLWEQLLIAGVVLLIAAVGVSLTFRLCFRLKTENNFQSSWMVQLMTGSLLLGFCLLLDKVDAYYLPLLGLDGTQVVFMGLEEFGEFVLGVYAVSVLWPYWQRVFSPDNEMS